MPKPNVPTGYKVNRAVTDSGRHDALFAKDGDVYLGDLTAPRGTPAYDEQVAKLVEAHNA